MAVTPVGAVARPWPRLEGRINDLALQRAEGLQAKGRGQQSRHAVVPGEAAAVVRARRAPLGGDGALQPLLLLLQRLLPNTQPLNVTLHLGG